MTIQELLLDDPTICSDCFGRVAIAHDGGTHRDRSTTTYEHADGGLPTDCEELFCDCGSPNPFERNVDLGAANRDRFREILKRAIRHLEGVDELAISRTAFAGGALQEYDRCGADCADGTSCELPANSCPVDGHDPTGVVDALGEGLDRGAVAT